MAVESYITDCLTKEVGLRRESPDLHFFITRSGEKSKSKKKAISKNELFLGRELSSVGEEKAYALESYIFLCLIRVLTYIW